MNRILMALFSAGCVVVPFFGQASGQVTFSRDVAPIIFNRCTGCHRAGEAAPFALMNYADVVKHGKLIASVTASRIMPPWKAEPASYAYKDSRRLSDAE